MNNIPLYAKTLCITFLKITFIIRLRRGLFKIWVNSTNCWLTQASKKRGSFPKRSLTRDHRGSWGGDLAATPHQKLELQLLIPAHGPSSPKSPSLERSGPDEFRVAVNHC